MNSVWWRVSLLVLLPVASWAAQLQPLLEAATVADTPQMQKKIELGRKLFFDRRLSGDGTMSCATCHDPQQGFSDGMEISLSYPTTSNWRNSPTLFNVAFQQRLFHDGRAKNLEEQALFPMMSAFEMNQNLSFVEEEIRAVPEYQADFTAIFGDGDTTKERIAEAIAAFERTIISCDAPLDRFLSGNKDALSPEAQRGYDIFTTKGGCIQCHQGATLDDGKFHVLLVPENPNHLNNAKIAATRRFVAKLNNFEDYRELTEDPGRYLITKDRRDWKAFKTPTLREVAATEPYMHNGIFASLDEVIDFFDAGGGKGNSEIQPLHLTAAEKSQLKTFLAEGLTGRQSTFIYPKIP